jgi:hypothetical protein
MENIAQTLLLYFSITVTFDEAGRKTLEKKTSWCSKTKTTDRTQDLCSTNSKVLNKRHMRSFSLKFSKFCPLCPHFFSPSFHKVYPLAFMYLKKDKYLDFSTSFRVNLRSIVLRATRKEAQKILCYRVRLKITFCSSSNSWIMMQIKKKKKRVKKRIQDNEWNVFCSLSLEGIKMP